MVYVERGRGCGWWNLMIFDMRLDGALCCLITIHRCLNKIVGREIKMVYYGRPVTGCYQSPASIFTTIIVYNGDLQWMCARTHRIVSKPIKAIYPREDGLYWQTSLAPFFFLYFLISSPKINFFFFISTKNYHHCRSRSEILSDIFWFNLFSIYSTLLSFYILCLYFLHMIYSWTYDAFPFKPIRCSVHYLDGFLRCKPIVLFFLNYFQYWKTKNFHATHVFLSFRIITFTNI